MTAPKGWDPHNPIAQKGWDPYPPQQPVSEVYAEREEHLVEETPPVAEPESFMETIRREAAAAASEEWERQQATVQGELVNYAREAGLGALFGKGAPGAVPDISVTTTTGKELTIASAKNRSWRTFVQGFGIDLGFALISVLALAFGDFDFLDGAAWMTLGVLLIKTVIQTAVSYVARLKLTPNYDKPMEALPSSLPGERAA